MTLRVVGVVVGAWPAAGVVGVVGSVAVAEVAGHSRVAAIEAGGPLRVAAIEVGGSSGRGRTALMHCAVAVATYSINFVAHIEKGVTP
jgi:hypothetical protein